MYNPREKKDYIIEKYRPSMAKDIFKKTYAHKIYKKNNENLEKTRTYLMEECVEYANNLYFIFSKDLEKMKKK